VNDDDIPTATPLAAEIYERFWRKMAPGGEIDRILNGGEPIEKVLPKSDPEIALIKKQIEIQLAEFEQEIRDAWAWYQGWKARERAKGFRSVRAEAEIGERD
jgi:hypothetical protein